MRFSAAVAGSVVLIAIASSISDAQSVDRERPYDYRQQTEHAPAVDLWLDQLEFSFGQHIRPFFASEPNAYVTIVRVTTDGELRVLYPQRPSDQRLLPTGSLANNRVPSYGDDRASRLYESSGTGFVFAIASYRRFDFRYFTTASQWSIARLASSRYGDPFAIVDQFVTRTLGSNAELSLDYMSYNVAGNSYARSRYASNFRRYTLTDYYERCLSSFSLRSSYYCNEDNGYYDNYAGYYGRYRGPFVVSRPQTPSNPARSTPRVGMRPRPLTPDPLVRDPIGPEAPLPSPAQGRFRVNDAQEAAAMRAAARREQEMRRERPSIRARDDGAERAESPRAIERQPRDEPQVQPREEPRALPRFEAPPQPRVEPRVESRPEPRAEPRVERHPEARTESRPAAQPVRAVPQPADPPAEKQ